MLILGIDTTAVSASVAIAEFNQDCLKTYSSFTVKNKMTHSENLMPMIDNALHLYGSSIDRIDAIAVNVGPGSFTGVRIGVSTAKGLALPQNLPCIPVSTLESLATNLEGIRQPVCTLMDARRGQFYYAFFENGKRLTEDSIAAAEEIFPLLKDNTVLCGDGANLFFSLYQGSLKLTVAPADCCDQNGLSVAVCGFKKYSQAQFVQGKDLRPVYLRLPQAERERLEKLANNK